MTVPIVSDVHANWPAFQSVLETEAFDEVVFLGDAVDCGPSPAPVVDALGRLTGTFVQGNHDRAVLYARPPLEHDRDRWQQWTRNQLTVDGIRFLESWSNTAAVRHEGLDLRAHHGRFALPASLPDEREWPSRLHPDVDEWVFETLAARFPEPYLLFGHSHIPFIRDVDGTTFVNPGSVGLQRPGR